MSCWCLRKAKGRGRSNKVLVWHAGWSSREGSCGRRRAGTNSSLPSCTKLCWRACLAAKIQILLYPGGQFAYSFLITGFPFTPGSSLALWKTLVVWEVVLMPISHPLILPLAFVSKDFEYWWECFLWPSSPAFICTHSGRSLSELWFQL